MRNISISKMMSNAFVRLSISHRKSLAEHKAAVKAMDQEKKELEEALAKSASEEKARLEHQRDNQQAMLAEHFKTKVSIQDPSVGEPWR